MSPGGRLAPWGSARLSSGRAAALLVVLLAAAPVAAQDETRGEVELAADLAPPPAASPRSGAAPVERLTLAECVARALAYAPELAVARSEVAIGEAKLAEAEASRFIPEAQALNFFGLARRARGTVLDPQDTVDVDAYGLFNRVEVSVVQPLFTWGKITAGIEAATHAVEARMAASRGAAGDVVEQVKSLYYNALLARSLEGILEEANDAFETALETARERRDAGDPDVTEVGILYLRVGLGQSAKALPAIRQGGEAAMQALRRAIGAHPTAPIELVERRLKPETARLRPIEEYADRLFTQSPDWRQIEAGVAAKSEEVRTVEADFYPTFFLTGTFIYSYAPRRDRQLNPFAYDYFNVLEGPGALLGVRWPLNFHVTAAKVDTARAELGRLEAQRRVAQTGLPVELKNAYDRAVQTRESFEKLEDARRAGRAILTLAVTNFDVGVGEARDIIEGLGTYSRVSSDYYEAVRDYDVALAALSRIVDEEVTDLDLGAATRALAAPAPEATRAP